MSNQAKWHFPPRNGGIDFIQDPSSAHFSDDPIPKLVREVVQNSLDARDSGIFDPVVVKFTDTKVERGLIGASQLSKHLTACLDRAKGEKCHSSVQRIYEDALKTLGAKRIRCLRITDSSTTGLSDSKWNALVVQEGAVQKSGVGAPGGSYGIGKNAVFNVSDTQTVFYSTRYVDGREGRVEKLQGKATLMSHPNPNNSNEDLQHIGFYMVPEGKPLFTKQIPGFFRLEETGTGVFIMGFNPRSSDWMNVMTSAVIENFFCAVHHKQLVVEISSQGSDDIVVTHETIDQLFEANSVNKPDADHYYKAIRDEDSTLTPEISKIGKLSVHVRTGYGPRRTAYVNRNGMLITDSRERKVNPIAPRGKSLWPDYAAVVVPATDSGDTWIRKMENPSHDSVSPRQLLEDKERRRAEKVFDEARKAIREIIDEKAEIERYGDTSNLKELAKIFPELDPNAQGNRSLQVRTVPNRVPQPQAQESDDREADDDVNNDDVNNEPELGPEPRPVPGPDPKPRPRPGPRPGPNPKPARRPKLGNPRIIHTGDTEAIIAFTPADDTSNPIKLTLTPAGEERETEEGIQIIEATVLKPDNQKMPLKDGVVSFVPDTNERVLVKVTTSNGINDLALKIG